MRRAFGSMLAPLLLLAGCGDSPPDPRGVGRDEVLLQVSATGRADTRPDEARITLGVDNLAPTAAAATAANNAVIQRVMTALRGLGVEDDHVQTRSVSLSRVGGGPDRGRFQAHNLIEIRVKQIARAGEAIAAATDAGANVLSGPNLAISDPEAANRSAYAAAYRAARARAEAYAEAAGMKVARVLVIRDSGQGGGGPRYGYDMDASAPAEMQTVSPPPPPDIRPGMTTSQVQVRADFALAPR
ncbi:MAG TPA: SIMPL domain-containing protein [Allosphingosinicella sp.]|jgi:uncharacterized protein YggE|nr:SIMPL domain-containing protein [Allosphingosinicella sp.]